MDVLLDSTMRGLDRRAAERETVCDLSHGEEVQRLRKRFAEQREKRKRKASLYGFYCAILGLVARINRRIDMDLAKRIV